MSTHSIVRQKQYDTLPTISNVGEVLDIGGSTKSGYHELLHGATKITTGNIDASFGCDIVFDVEKPFPMPDAQFDTVIALNLFEHVYEYRIGFVESFRVLRKGGRFVFSTPFMFHIHGSPSDFHRYTKACLEKVCTDAGFENIEITEIGEGVLSLVYQTICGVIPTKVLKLSTRASVIWIDRTLGRLVPKYKNLAKKIPLAYFVIATK